MEVSDSLGRGPEVITGAAAWQFRLVELPSHFPSLPTSGCCDVQRSRFAELHRASLVPP